ncbi:uncharacterized protein LOC122879486 isoform X4 [Siniperca chuatsi]|uniref:uncharacterized protein LOC122879486 isoform X4 n=1 Tax=Siniperca chuatsi TaxID=119488 RepID=UPI001CE20BD8|nr:uncharacterized protein LOC122879486 isoform X4 [Siniperca chuatsi]
MANFLKACQEACEPLYKVPGDSSGKSCGVCRYHHPKARHLCSVWDCLPTPGCFPLEKLKEAAVSCTLLESARRLQWQVLWCLQIPSSQSKAPLLCLGLSPYSRMLPIGKTQGSGSELHFIGGGEANIFVDNKPLKKCPATPVASPVVSADTIIPKQECPATPVASPVVSADTIIPKQEPRITSYLPPIELKNLTPHPLKPPPPTPEDPQPQPDLGPPKCLPIRDRSFLLSSPKYSNIINQAQVPLDHKVLQLYKKFKYGNKNSSYKKLSNTAVHPPATHSTIQTKTRGPNLYSGLGTHSAQFAQTICPKDQSGPKSMPEWRKSLYKLISLQGLRSPRATRLAATDHLVKSSDARQLAATIPSLQPGQAATHQRVVQKIQMKDTLEPTPFHFHYVIPKASQHSFVTLNPCGKTMYGRLQFDWMRGSEEDNLLKVSAVKAKICSKSSATLSKRSAQQLASCTISL